MHRNVLWVLQAEPHQILDLPKEILIRESRKSGLEACLFVRKRNASAATDNPGQMRLSAMTGHHDLCDSLSKPSHDGNGC